jgi:hypothetical protein
MTGQVKGRIFEPYFTTKCQKEGKGLGLSMVQEIVENHGGFISVFSEKDKGTVFKIHLLASEKKIQKPSVLPKEKPTLGKETILLVDNEKVLRETARKMLTRYGYKVISAENGAEAVSIYKKYLNRIDLIILDMFLPGINCCIGYWRVWQHATRNESECCRICPETVPGPAFIEKGAYSFERLSFFKMKLIRHVNLDFIYSSGFFYNGFLSN